MLLLDIISVVLVVIILLSIILYLNSINKKLNQKILQEKNRFILYKKKLIELQLKPNLTKKELDNLNILARDFFKERFNLGHNLSYSELSRIFKNENPDERVDFCNKMQVYLYSGEKTDSEEIRKMVGILLDIVDNYKQI